ncbi:myotubularin-related protein 14 [Phymastichus coffea]|uniref:myotubularin-related protein 14 n=1 Tax=Phymastichus coffea TaxID=108790 RepID=UPI00273B00BD|nr:myotubularin-related protein 14 [Phymastichus coffea]XP_058796335.1 myotubularin-related protein 14 [Phymastichus coffea]XP_058796336.1 myotubularin-related protein 14 [Phymastichus coffea]XP_058796337.1 myotubularin-related protein 14 [Phymastichus coffea]
MTDITTSDLHDLLKYFSKNTYKANETDSIAQAIMQRCILLADLDYSHTIVNNSIGDLSAHYPSHLIILEYDKKSHQNLSDTSPPQRTTETIYESIYEPKQLKELIKNARIARCRSRFPLPVILYKGRNICRSATLSGGPEIYGRSGYEYLFSNSDSNASMQESVEERSEEPGNGEWQLFHKFRSQDIRLLKMLNVGTIIDFMVEKKKVKFGINVTSSEKVDKEQRYSDFTIISLPYPGCEFFREFRENDYLAVGLVFDWSQPHIDAKIGIPEDPISSQLQINWEQYQVWDLVNLTQNYFRLILKYLNDSSNGMLFHCISGWDRTPLFISLLRISLWADGAIHQTLNAKQLLYFTIAYDWMLFGHDLQDRLGKGEEIFYFCFHFLKYIYEDEFSVNKQRHSNLKHPVLRNDSDLQLDNVMFDTECTVAHSTVSSNLSLNSCCSNNSRDSQENNAPMYFFCSSADSTDDTQTNGNVIPQTNWSFYSPNKADGSSTTSHGGSRSPLPTSASRTSPVAVPVPSRVRQRNESSSSAGSWQLISATGSLRGSTTTNAPVLLDHPLSGSSFSSTNSAPAHNSHDSSTTVIEEDHPYVSRRQRRLESLRQMFSSVYSQTIGLKMKDNSDTTGISQLLGNIAEKVGIISVRTSS